MNSRCALPLIGPALLLVLATSEVTSSNPAFGESFIVKDGRPCAEIVISDKPARMTKLAADELQAYVQKITGAKLPIRTEPGGGFPVRIYVGKSAHTDGLGVSDEGLKYGAFRMVSGPDWLVLLGQDFDFEPREPYAHTRSDQARVQEEWDKVSGGTWLCPMNNLFRFYHNETGTWFHDQGGGLQRRVRVPANAGGALVHAGRIGRGYSLDGLHSVG